MEYMKLKERESDVEENTKKFYNKTFSVNQNTESSDTKIKNHVGGIHAPPFLESDLTRPTRNIADAVAA